MKYMLATFLREASSRNCRNCRTLFGGGSFRWCRPSSQSFRPLRRSPHPSCQSPPTRITQFFRCMTRINGSKDRFCVELEPLSVSVLAVMRWPRCPGSLGTVGRLSVTPTRLLTGSETGPSVMLILLADVDIICGRYLKDTNIRGQAGCTRDCSVGVRAEERALEAVEVGG